MEYSEKLIRSVSDTKEHIEHVRNKLQRCAILLLQRGQNHDTSKLSEPEVSAFAATYGELGKTEYNSPEYKELLNKIRPAIDHHYQVNTHHPEHYSDGISGYDLLDLIEMLCDWCAAVKRNKNGDIYKSIDINCEKHKIDPQIKQMLINTVLRYNLND